MALRIPPRQLARGQRCQVWVHDVEDERSNLVLESDDVLLEAPNWTLDGDALVLNGAGLLWRITLAAPSLLPIPIEGVPPMNNDHVLHPDGVHVVVSTYDDWQLYLAPLDGGPATLITDERASGGLMHFLHGVSPDGQQLAFVGVRADESAGTFVPLSAEIYTVAADGTDYRQLTQGGAPADGPEYSPDGEWLYFNTEQFDGHAQLARMRPDGTEVTRLSTSPTVDWFPHISPDGRRAVYIAFPPGTHGHPADLDVDLMVVQDGRWDSPTRAVSLLGGQGTINVNSWSPDSRRFAYVAYPRS